jgi:uncharacterized membrane protein YcaP (DUF421 family)
VVASTVALYMVFLLLLRLIGQRVLAGMSSFDFAGTIALGAVMGRAVLGYTPTLPAGILAMCTLFSLLALSFVIRRIRRIDRLLNAKPVLLMADGRLLRDQLQRTHVLEDELRQKLRLAGVSSYDGVAAAILERTGSISVIRRGEAIGLDLLMDVRGAERLRLTEVSS